jgi:hypothetical protein
MMEFGQKQKPVAYEFEVTLCDVRPTVWRHFQVPADITFHRLHEVIQLVMGWQDYHLYEFRFGNLRASVPDPDGYYTVDETHFDSRRKRIGSLGLEPNDVLGYLYDMGDDWMHTLRMTYPIYDLDDGPPYACLDGEGACPPEDVGGPPGYEHFLTIVSEPDNPEYAAMMEWSGGNFDPKVFDKKSVTRELRRRFVK